MLFRSLVDVAVVDDDRIGSRAVWDPALLRELAVTFAEPHGIGLSAIAGSLSPCGRQEPTGRLLTMGEGTAVTAAIAPGLVRSVPVAVHRSLLPGEPVALASTSGVIAFDGERELVFRAGDMQPTIELSLNGPLVINVEATLALAAERRLLLR